MSDANSPGGTNNLHVAGLLGWLHAIEERTGQAENVTLWIGGAVVQGELVSAAGYMRRISGHTDPAFLQRLQNRSIEQSIEDTEFMSRVAEVSGQQPGQAVETTEPTVILWNAKAWLADGSQAHYRVWIGRLSSVDAVSVFPPKTELP